MNKGKLILVVVVAICLSIACTAAKTAKKQEIPRMTKDELRAKLDDASVVIIDVRTPKDYDNSDSKIKGAIRENPMDVTFWSPYPKDKTIVLYCA